MSLALNGNDGAQNSVIFSSWWVIFFFNVKGMCLLKDAESGQCGAGKGRTGLYIPLHIYTHIQIYIALFRFTQLNVCVCVKEETLTLNFMRSNIKRGFFVDCCAMCFEFGKRVL